MQRSVRNAPFLRSLFGFVSLCLILLVAGCSSPATPAPTGAASTGPKFIAALYAGTYKGTWTNTATGATGPATIDIKLDAASHAANLTIDFDGNYLGLADPPAASLSGTYDDAGARVKGSSILFGDYDVTISPDGKIVGVMKKLAGGIIPEMTYTGLLTGDSLDADYVVTFADGKTANSILRMKKAK